MPVNLFIAAYTTIKNIIKIFTEFLPYTVFTALTLVLNFSAIKYGKREGENTFAYAVLFAVTLPFWCLSLTATLIGRAVTSPVNSVEAIWNFCQNTGLDADQEESMSMKLARFVMGSALCFVSISVTITAYTFLFPLLIKMIPVLGTDIAACITKVGELLSPFLSSIGTTIAIPVFTKLATAVGFLLSPVVSGLAMLAGSALVMLGVIADKLIDVVDDYWFRTGYAQDENECVVSVSDVFIHKKLPHKPKAIWHDEKQVEESVSINYDIKKMTREQRVIYKLIASRPGKFDSRLFKGMLKMGQDYQEYSIRNEVRLS